MNRRFVVALTMVVGAGFCGLLLKADPPATQIIEQTEVLMRAKLTSSQNVLAGLL